MDKRELASLLRGLAALVEAFPEEKSIPENLSDLIGFLKTSQSTNPFETDQETEAVLEASIPDNLDEVFSRPLEQILEYLEESPGFTRDELFTIADSIGVTTRNRMTKSTLIHLIIKQVELRRTDALLRQRRPSTDK